MTLTDQSKLLDGRYQIHEPLGSGGMARVHRGLDVELQRPVAIKLLPPDRSRDQNLRSRMTREAQAMARLNHPHVVQVYGCARATSDIPYIITELVEGTDLADALLNRGAMPWELALWVVERCLSGLMAIHSTSIIHRDIKPSNILVTRAGVPKIADLGIAHFADRTAITAEGAQPGTLAYMPPEAFESGAASPQFDLYAMGCVLYELIAGRPAFEQDTTASLINQILRGRYAPLNTLAPDVAPRVCALLERALSTSPRDRHSSAEAMRDECRAILEAAGALELSDVSCRWFTDPPDRSWVARLRGARPAPVATASTPTAPRVAAVTSAITDPATLPARVVARPVLAGAVAAAITALASFAVLAFPPADSTPPADAAVPHPASPAAAARVIIDSGERGMPVELLDGTVIGQTGASIRLAPGQHSVVIRALNFEDVQLALNLTAGQSKTYKPVLRRRTVAAKVTTVPPGAEIAVDDEPRGKLSEVSVLAGRTTRVTARLPGYRPASTTFTIDANKEKEISLVLVPEEVEVQVQSAPPGALVLAMTGASIGVTPLKLAVPAGQILQYTLSLAGYAPATVRGTAVPGTPLVLVGELEKAQSASAEPVPAQVAPHPVRSPAAMLVRTEVLSTPPGATVSTVSGEVLGTTPLAVHVPAGETVTYYFKLDGYRTGVVNGRGTAGETMVLHQELESRLGVDLAPSRPTPLPPSVGARELRLEVARSLFLKRDLAQAEVAIQEVLALDPRHTESWLMLARVYVASDAADRAEEAMRKAHALEPTRGDVLDLYAMVLMRVANYPRAEEMARALVQLSPADPNYLATQAVVLCMQGKHVKVRELAERALKLRPDLGTIRVLKELLAGRCP